MTPREFAAQLNEAELVGLAKRFAPKLDDGGVIHLRGDLGAGKTTFARALLQMLGVEARIKSPTYSLVESYSVHDLAVHHLDLYRIADAGELEWLGLADLTSGRHLILIEWPERGAGALPMPDLTVHLAHAGAQRAVRLEARSQRGQRWLTDFPA